ncbi:MAG: GGDEF and EAL domain-containing protein [Acidobacteria bacterium]|jgi:diguanylate cyclase (GGDEF)-like protein/PAS domain S-box-containing protein|nr:GGDEF and EAL domain-containing protein [Acidobacteriota bacterium]
MSKPLRAVAVIDSPGAASAIAADLEACGHDGRCLMFASGEDDLGRLSRASCTIVLACQPNPALKPERVIELLRARDDAPPVVVSAESFSDDEMVSLVKAGAHDCVRRGDTRRLASAIQSARSAPPSPSPATPDATALTAELTDHHRALIEEIPALTYVCWADETRSVIYVSPQLLAMTGYSTREWLADPGMWASRLHPEDRNHVLRRYHDACKARSRFVSEYRILDHQGGTVWWRDEGRVMPGPDGGARFVRGFVLDITEQKLAEESVRRMRFFDQLTNLPNRSLMQLRLSSALSASQESGRPVALLILAVDRFRDTVNTLGHQCGEEIVRELARRLADTIGDAERVARLRGDEFGVLLPDADAELARNVGGRILKAFERPIMVERLPIELSASVGVAVAPDHAKEGEDLLRRADAAVQAARGLGGGTCTVYSAEHDLHDPENVALLGELRRAVEADDLLLHYQPKVDLHKKTIVGVEALLRWPHSKRGMVPPGTFIPLAEKTGLMRELTRLVLDKVARQARGWQKDGWPLPVAVNVSARSLHDRLIVDDVADALRTHDVDPARLQIEITESAVMADENRAVETLSGLTGKGVGISIDDFGIGYTSLRLLRRLPVSELKIDRSFVMGMAGEAGEDTAIVRSTNDLGHNLGLTVVAEGVENEWTLDLLSAFGCDLAQGFHIARPMPPAELPGWIARSDWKMAEC